MLRLGFANGSFAVTNVDDGGAIVPGAPADLLLLDWAALDDDRLRDDIDVLDLLMARVTARHMRELIVAGRSVVLGGKVLGVDYPAARDEVIARTDLPELVRSDVQVLIAVGRLWGEEALQRCQFTGEMPASPSKFGMLPQGLRG